jgi:hypothetical protein
MTTTELIAFLKKYEFGGATVDLERFTFVQTEIFTIPI